MRRWLSADALAQLERVRLAVNRWAGRPSAGVVDPLLPSSPVTIGGLVYTTMFNIGDPRKNYLDLLSAFLIAFRDRPDVTLVIKLVTNPVREHHEVGLLRQRYLGLGMRHRCRVVVITDFLSNEQMTRLMQLDDLLRQHEPRQGRVSAAAAGLAGGRPALAPAHSASAITWTTRSASSSRRIPEPAIWPHDPERRLETYWHRLVWSSLRDNFVASARVAETNRAATMHWQGPPGDGCTVTPVANVADRALRAALALLPESELGGFAWAS